MHWADGFILIDLLYITFKQTNDLGIDKLHCKGNSTHIHTEIFLSLSSWLRYIMFIKLIMPNVMCFV